MGIPQILMIVLFTIRIVVAIATHDKISVYRRNVVYDVLADAILISILYAGGFWSQ